jgi:hypothetical protein
MTLPATHASRDPMTLPTIHLSREDWLTAAVEELRPSFAAIYAPVPVAIRVACGFPSNARRSGAIGECWADTASADGTIEILISPTVANPAHVFEVLVHELCHSTAGAMNHGASFQAVAAAMHLQASSPAKEAWKATGPAAGFYDAYSAIISSLGAYPHAALSLAEKPKQATRMLKASCPTCGYTVRLTQKWASLSLPICGTDGESFILETGETA